MSNMKKIALVLGIFAGTALGFSQTVRTQGYYKPSTRTYVQSFYKSTPNSTNHDNYSTKGNLNPYTGRSGTKARDYSVEARNYGIGKTIYTGSRGGQYYINRNGNKTYVPKR